MTAERGPLMLRRTSGAGEEIAMKRALLVAGASCAAIALAVIWASPYQPPVIGPGDIVPLAAFSGLRPMKRGYNGPVVWLQNDDGWWPMNADELKTLPYTAGGYHAVLIEQVAAEQYFNEFGKWPEKPTNAQVLHFCEWERQWAFSTIPCEDLGH